VYNEGHFTWLEVKPDEEVDADKKGPYTRILWTEVEKAYQGDEG